MTSVASQGTYVQYGCGLSCPDGWLNFDASPTLRLQRVPGAGRLFRHLTPFPAGVRFGDIVKGLPVPDASADAVYASHVLEHLPYEDFWTALGNTLRILKPGGVFRLIVPDLEQRARRYLAARDQSAPEASTEFVSVTGLGRRSRRRGPSGRLRTAFGNSGHLWMWDEGSMRAALDRTGFTGIRRCEIGDSEIPAYSAVEDPGRFYDASLAMKECAMEARRPG